MRDKKGILVLEETIKILLAVACIALLISLSVTMYGVFKGKAKEEQARSTLDEFVSKINTLSEGSEKSMLANSPKGWYIVYYDIDKVLEDHDRGIPKQCGKKDCVCLCQADLKLENYQKEAKLPRGYLDYFYYPDKGGLKGLTYCEKGGMCKPVNYKLTFDSLRFYGSSTLKAAFVGGNILARANWVSLHEAPVGLIFKKSGERVHVLEKSKDSEGEILKGLLSRQIVFDGETISFRDFTVKKLANSCAGEGQIDGRLKSIMSEEVDNYISELKSSKKISDGKIIFYKIVLDKGYESLNGGIFDGLDVTRGQPLYDDPRTEILTLCNGDFILYVESEVKNE